MSPPSSSRYTFESPLVKLSYLEMAQTHMERVVGDSSGQDRRWRVSVLGGAEYVRRLVSAAFPKNWFSLEKQVLPGGSLQEAMSLSAVPARGTASGCGLCRVSAAWMAPVPAPPWHSPGLLSARCCAHTACRPQALAEGLLEKESCLRVT